MSSLDHAHGSQRRVGAGQDTSLWRSAIQATLHCLTGCAIGEVLGMVIATAFGWGNAASIGISIVPFISSDPALCPSTRMSYAPRRTSAPMALCVSFSVAVTVDPLRDSGVVSVGPGGHHRFDAGRYVGPEPDHVEGACGACLVRRP